MDKATITKVMRLIGSRGGSTAAKNMTAAERTARAKAAAKASAKVRTAARLARERKEGKLR